MIYFTSDWHIGHQNVLAFDQRPFRDLQHMHDVLVGNYRASVKDDDVVFFLGDVGLAKTDLVSGIISALPGTKILVRGNHDRKNQAGFQAIVDTVSLTVGGEVVTASHCPLLGVWREDVTGMRGAVAGENWHGETRHQRLSVENRGQFHLHGHTHKSREERVLGRQWDVGVRANNYRPVSIRQIESWINKTKAGSWNSGR
jgi:calcineurin-like phosphoesterase family protein